jgi:hypothetical protein
MNICVLCRISRLGHEPSAFYLARQRHSVAAILNRWADRRIATSTCERRTAAASCYPTTRRQGRGRSSRPSGRSNAAALRSMGGSPPCSSPWWSERRFIERRDGPAAPSSAKERARRRAQGAVPRPGSNAETRKPSFERKMLAIAFSSTVKASQPKTPSSRAVPADDVPLIQKIRQLRDERLQPAEQPPELTPACREAPPDR